MTPHHYLDKLFTSYDHGRVTKSELQVRILEFMQNLNDDKLACELCGYLPSWFRPVFSELLTNLAKSDYYGRWVFIGDPRTTEQVETDAKLKQRFLKRIAPSLKKHLENDT